MSGCACRRADSGSEAGGRRQLAALASEARVRRERRRTVTVEEVVRGAGAVGVEQVVVVLAVGDVVGDSGGAAEPAGERGLGADMVRVYGPVREKPRCKRQWVQRRGSSGTGSNEGLRLGQGRPRGAARSSVP